MGELLSEIGDMVFSLVIGYIGAIEFLYVVRHLYHWSFNHENPQDNDADSLTQLQERIRNQLSNAADKEDPTSGITAMQDGVAYKDGFRIDPNQSENDRLKQEIQTKEEKDKRRKELEEALARQKKIEEETRKQLAEAEATLARQQREAEENDRKLVEAEQKREREQREREEKEAKKEAEENERKILEAEKQREEEQRRKEEAKENERKILEAEKQREEEQRRKEEAEENERKIIAAEKQREEEQRHKEEAEENERRIIESEKQREQQQRQLEEDEAEQQRQQLEIESNLASLIQAEDGLTESERQLIEAIKQRDEAALDSHHHDDNDLLNRLMQVRQQQLDDESEDEQSLRLLQNERDQAQKQRRIEENALLFLEAEMKMAAELETKREYASGMESAPQTPAIEEPCIKRTLAPLQDTDDSSSSPKHSVKTQLSQHRDKTYSLSTKALVFPGVSDDASSIEPESSQKSSFSTQPSDELTTTGNESHYVQQQQLQPEIRLEPEGEDTTPSQQYTEDYLRSLDGIKQRPLMREDGSGRRRAYKKRRSSGSSNSSRDSRTSRDEELKMFTSLEEEEMKNTTESEFTPIRYSSEPMLKVKNHHRRHKRSPAKDMATGEDSLRASLERLGEETTNPWGDVVPEHYKNTEFWKREKALSIDEEIEFEKPLSSEEMAYDTATNLPSASSFEEATQVQNEEAITTLKKQLASKDSKDNDDNATKEGSGTDDNNSNLQNLTSENISQLNTPTIAVHSPLDFGSWRDQHGLVMEGLSDFYDFTASVNPSRSRSASRNPSPNPSAPSTPLPKNVSFVDSQPKKETQLKVKRQRHQEKQTTSLPQTPEDLKSWRDENGLLVEGLSDFYDFTASVNRSRSASRNPTPNPSAPSSPLPKNVSFDAEEADAANTLDVYDDTDELADNELKKENIIRFIESLSGCQSAPLDETETQLFAESLQNVADDRTQAVSDLVPMVNIIEESGVPMITTEQDPNDDMNSLIASLRADRVRSSRSRSRSPLPTPGNLERSLESRRNKMIKHNEDVLEMLIETKLLPESEAVIEEKPQSSQSQDQDLESSRQNMSLLIDSLRAERAGSRSRSRSRSPLPTAENLQKSLETRRNKRIKQNDELFEQLAERTPSPVMYSNPTQISIEIEDTTVNDCKSEDNCSREEMNALVQSLRLARSRSRSKTPMYPTINIETMDDEEVAISTKTETEESYSTDDMIALVQSLRVARSRTRSKSPMHPAITIESPEDITQAREENDSHESVQSLVQSLRVDRARSRSKTPMRLPTADNLNKSVESRRNRLIAHNDDIMQHMEERARTPEPPRISMEYVYEYEQADEADELVKNRDSRSRTPSRSPSMGQDLQHERSRTPSRSLSPAVNEDYELIDSNSNTASSFEDIDLGISLQDIPKDCSAFNMLLNLEGSENKTLSKNTEECESALAQRQRRLDNEALEKFRTASEETELRVISPTSLDSDEAEEYLGELPAAERYKSLRYSPNSPDFNRTISQEMLDVERIRKEMIESGFKRSTYAGESMDLGSEFEPLRREAAQFRRSRSPSPSLVDGENTSAQRQALEKQKIQELILSELTKTTEELRIEQKNTGAIPKTPSTLSGEIEDTLRIKEDLLKSGFQRSTYPQQSMDLTMDMQELRQRNAEFRRSASKSRSPLEEKQILELAEIESEVAKRELQDKILDEFENSTMNFHDFSQHLNPNFLDNDRRASDSALIQKPEILIQFQDSDYDLADMEPEEYHHYRRFSLAQEQPVEEYPNEDYIFIQQVEVRTRSGSRTWLREDFYSEDVNDFLTKRRQTPDGESSARESNEMLQESGGMQAVEEADQLNNELMAGAFANIENEDEYDSNNSEDERQTVVEVEDEIDEDISDFNERGPAEESHHEQSECEEAEREMDRYADRDARDWQEAVDVENIFVEDETEEEEPLEEGAVGICEEPIAYDSDDVAIDQIYDEAIKNRKQSGILREYDIILKEMTNNFMDNEVEAQRIDKPKKRKTKNVEFVSSFLESERKDTEVRYLGNATATARQSTRLRSRYGYNPVLPINSVEADIEVDLNYKPRREYNWRKNFKLDDDDANAVDGCNERQQRTNDLEMQQPNDFEEWQEQVNTETTGNMLDIRKYSLGGESITLFSRSPEREILMEEQHAKADYQEIKEDPTEEKLEKPKKKKTKKKSRKEAKESMEALNKYEDDSENQIYTRPRRSSSIQLEAAVDSPKRKSHSRRSSRSSITNEIDSTLGLLSPRNSVGLAEPIQDIMEEYCEMKTEEIVKPKKTKKRKKVKEIARDAENDDSKVEKLKQIPEGKSEYILPELDTISTVITPESASLNILSPLSPQNSVCVTPGSEDAGDCSPKELASAETTTPNSTSTPNSRNTSGRSSIAQVATPVDNFDILKDANFYPLF